MGNAYGTTVSNQKPQPKFPGKLIRPEDQLVGEIEKALKKEMLDLMLKLAQCTLDDGLTQKAPRDTMDELKISKLGP